MKIPVPTTLSDADNQRFRELYLKHFNEELTVDEANRKAYRLLSFYAVVIGHKESKRR
ncbi:MAG: hypothetical protein RLP14_08140 [Owenweeksia sp.]|tara:strand:+ start:2440 stop:2613 length:174 start_codon:yes stop_codon:yes gene_type:complete